MSTCVHGLVAHVCCKLRFDYRAVVVDPATLTGPVIRDLTVPLPRPPCAHVFLGPFDACLACGTPNPATLR